MDARVGNRTRKERAERDLEVIQSMRKALLESLLAAAMDDEIEATHNYFGVSSGSSAETLVAVPEPAGADRLRALGWPTFLIGLSSGLNEQTTRIHGTSENESTSDAESSDRARSLLTLGLLTVLAVTAVARHRHNATGFLMVIGCVGMLAFMGGPVAAAAGLAIAAAGWISRPRRQGPTPAPSLPAGQCGAV